MSSRKVNVGVKLSRNFNTVTVDILDEPVEFEGDEEFKAKLRQLGKLCREEAALQLEQLR